MTGRGGSGTGRATLGRPDGMIEAAAAVVSGLGAALVGAALVWAPQEHLVWQPPRPRARHRVAPAGAHRLDFTAPDGQPLLAWLVEPDRGDGGSSVGTLVAFHGNAELAAWGVPWARRVAERTGWRVVLPEYRGYAGLGGAPAYRYSAGDARAAFDAAVGQAPGVSPVALFGHSLGSAVAAELASELADEGRAPGALLLQSPLTSARGMARLLGRAVFDAWWARITRVGFDTVARVAALDVPVWVAHGATDLVIPAWMGRAVFAAARRPGELLVVPWAGHNRLPTRGGERYWGWLERALAGASAPRPRRRPPRR